MDSLTLALFWNLGKYPSFTFHEDQWGEYGWVYDPQSDRYLAYDIDRKCQCDGVSQVRTRAEMIADVLPGAKKKLRDWFADFTVARTETDAYVLSADGSIRRYSLGEMRRDTRNRPVQEVETVAADELPEPIRAALCCAD